MKSKNKYSLNLSMYNRLSYYTIMDAIKKLKEMHNYNFEESIDLSISIKKNLTLVQSTLDIIFPHGNGKKKEILLLTNNNDLKEICNKFQIHFEYRIELIENIIKNKKIKYVIVTPDMNIHIKKMDKFLKKNKMTLSYKSESNIESIENIVRKIKNSQKITISNKNKIINISIGRKSYKTDIIYINLIEAIKSITRRNIKISFINNITITTTMCPGIMIDIDDIKGNLIKRGM